MYDIRQFKPALYALLLLGMSGFALAARLPTLWILAVTATLVNAWLVKTGRFRPMPRLLANLVTLVTMLYMVLLWSRGTPAVLLFGELLLVLQLVKLYEQHSNRNYAQLLVLSLLLMVAASISTASALFGAMLIAYLFLSLYCCLLFHLKMEAEQAKAMIPVPPEELDPATLRQDQRFLTRSMRRLTGLIAFAAVSMAVLVFLFCPRLPTPPLMGAMQFPSSETLTGFSENVGYQQVARIAQNDAIVAHVTVHHNGKPVAGTTPLLLRGATLDRYNGNGDNNTAAWSWDHTHENAYSRFDCHEDEITRIALNGSSDRWVQNVSLYPTGSNAIFAMAGVMSLRPDRQMTVDYFPGDQTLQALDPVVQQMTYQVVSCGYVGDSTTFGDEPADSSSGRPSPVHSQIDPMIARMARNPQVTGVNANGPLWRQRPVSAAHSALDGQIARNIEQYLRTHYTYTLDLTDTARIAGRDPMVAFLYDFKRGHCEYFAGAMTLLCQSLGLPARMVVGFRCDDYNSIGGYYIVRQNQAHAWVEVQMPDGIWKTFDPTSGRQSPLASAGLWQTMRHALDFIEYTWSTNVIAYDRTRRDNLMMNAETGLTRTAIRTSDWVSRTSDWVKVRENAIQNWLFSEKRWNGTYQLVSSLTAILVLALMGAVVWFVVERWRMRRRALRIGIDMLPSSDQLRLARQLRFYDELLRLLERRGIFRGAHLTPLEFSESLSFLPAEAYDSVRRLTRIFYRVRYGGKRLHGAHQRRLALTITRLEQRLPARA